MRNWFDPRAVALAALFALAAALPVTISSGDRRDFYFFDVTLTSTRAGTTQIFWDLGQGFNEHDSSSQPLKAEAKPVRYRYMLPFGTIRALQLKPADRGSILTLSRSQIVDHHGRILHEFAPGDFKAGEQIARLAQQDDALVVETGSTGSEPTLALRLDAPLDLPRSKFSGLAAGASIFLPVFFLGLILGSRLVASRVQRITAPAGAWAHREPCRAVALTALAVALVQMHPVLFCGRSFVSPNNGSLMLYGEQPTLPGATQSTWTDGMGSDTGAMLFQHLYYPMVQRDALLKYREWPLWDRYNLGGEPLLGQGQSMFGDPFNFLTILADGASWSWDARFALAHWLFVAGLGLAAWRLCGNLGAALLTTVGAGFVGFFGFRLNHPATFSVCYAPWIAWAWLGLIKASDARIRLRWLGALITANGIVMASGTVKEAYVLMLCLNLAGLCWLALLPAAAGRRWRIFGAALAAGAVFFLITAPLWWSFLDTLRNSWTASDHPHADPLPRDWFIGFFDDMFYRQGSADEHVVAPSLNFLFLLGALWWLSAPGIRRDRASLATLIAGLVPFAFAFGIVPAALIDRIPFVGKIVHVGTTFSCPLIILAALLAGFGFREFIEQANNRGWWIRFGSSVLLAGALVLVHFHSLQQQPRSLFFVGYAWSLALGGAGLLIGSRWASRADHPGLLHVSLLLGLSILLWRNAQYTGSRFNHYVFTPGERIDFHATSPAVTAVNEHRQQPGRVIGWDNNLFPSYYTLWRWESLYGADALRSTYYQELAETFHLEKVWRWAEPTPEADAAKLRPAHDLLNVTLSVAAHGDSIRTIAGWRMIGRRDLDVFESPTAWPRAFFTDRLAVYGSVEDFAGRVRANGTQPFAAVQSDTLDSPRELSTELTGRIVRPATDYVFTANTTRFTIDAPTAGIAVLTEAFYANDFIVTIDGAPASCFRVNHAFKGVFIGTTGRHEISFSYWPRHFTAALIFSTCGLIAAGLGAWLVIRSPAPLLSVPPRVPV